MTIATLVWRAVHRLSRVARRYSWRNLTAPQLFVVSFLILIGLGTAGLRLLPGLYNGTPLSWLDSLFTATSAVCVTGLTIVDTATYFTVAGQAWLLLLIQLGGLGMLSFTTLIIRAFGGRLPMQHELLSRSVAEATPHLDYHKVLRDAVVFTFVFETAGATLLYLCWIPRLGLMDALWPAWFHSISAFCNAGFSTFSDSLMQFADSPGTLMVVMVLIVVGGIGFLTIEEILEWVRARRQTRVFRFSIHTQLVLVMTAVLIVGGWVGLTVFEWNVSLARFSVVDRLLNGLFMSITPRTAGFNTIDYGQATDSANFLTILLMSIGGSPGSIAGGLKTTTVALLGLLAWSRLCGYEVAVLNGRTIPEETVQRAVGLFVLMFGVVTVAIFVYTTTELAWVAPTTTSSHFLRVMFEAASALNTVGLSMGLTPELSEMGRAVTIGLMILGRVGPLTFAAALARRHVIAVRKFRYAYEDVAIG
ncbi:MAG: Ktr system potassium uptake protein B [Verrucomicrobiae bacterium]|nr:Ktr system potassium uptake protein B [Verrucomicrobiae bacterium]